MTDAAIRDILKKYRVIASVGMSADPARPSNSVGAYLLEHGYHVIPVNPNEKEVLGQKAYPDLDSISEAVEIVQIFRRPEAVPAVVEAAIRKGAKVVWMQDGAGHLEAARRAEEAGLIAVVDDCMMRRHQRLLG